MSSTVDVHLLTTPLAMYFEHHFQDLDFAARYNPLHRAPFRRLQHWAIQVGDNVYEVTRRGTDLKDSKEPDLRLISTLDWWDECDRREATVRRHFLGVTYLPKDKLDIRAESVWEGVGKKYKVATNNCQTFASIFQRWIIDNRNLTRERRADIQPLPWSFNPFTSVGEKLKQVQRYCTRSENVAAVIKRLRQKRRQDSPVAAIPRRPSSVWLDAFKNEAREPRNAEHDFYSIVQQANKRLRPFQRKSTWQRLRLIWNMRSPGWNKLS